MQGPAGEGGSSGDGITTYDNFYKSTNRVFFEDDNIRLRWDANDEIMITALVSSPSDIYAYAHYAQGSVSYPSSNPMILSTMENDFVQRSGQFYVQFSVRSDGDFNFPYYRVGFESCGSSGFNMIYSQVTKYI